MTSRQTRQYEMLVKVGTFGKEHRDLFPKSTEGGQAFATVADMVTQLATYDDSKTKTSEEGQHAKAIARRALLDRLRSISRTAAVIARKTPGFADGLKVPPGKPADQAVLGIGRVFVDTVERSKDRFVAHGMPRTFFSDLKRLVETFDEAIRAREAGKEQRAVAQKGLAAALESGLDAVSALDVIVANQLGDDRDARAAWEHDRKIEFSRRSRRGTPEEAAAAPSPSTPLTTVPSAVGSPASGGTSVPAVTAATSDAGPAGKAA